MEDFQIPFSFLKINQEKSQVRIIAQRRRKVTNIIEPYLTIRRRKVRNIITAYKTIRRLTVIDLIKASISIRRGKKTSKGKSDLKSFIRP
jgi:hypothetical protein